MSLKSLTSMALSKAGRQILTVQKHSPALLFGAGLVGIVTTVVLASRATLKLEQVLEETQSNLDIARKIELPGYTDKDRQRDIALVYLRGGIRIAKLYGPCFVIGVASVSALSGAHVILNRRNVGLTAAYAALDKAYKEYQKRVANEVGEDKERDLRYGTISEDVVTDGKTGPVVTKVKRADPNSVSGYARFFDQCVPNWQKTPEYNLFFLKAQQNYANDMLRARGHVFLNEVYDMIGLERSKAGAVVGWVLDKGKNSGDNYIDFGIFDGDNPAARDFVNGREGAILLDFNVDGVIYDKI